ncbi:cellulose-binding domain-containing protein [Rhizomonospora bruguierae]|uniref:cellulose-binding domain-containing protein n=1 Tax=Rhizomonospora bruguierae TaxID=1581705 RepID=UPI001BCD62BE|nr:cellulose-binding domain-containing protein [Micromonospora sp. NBRC 107566]
MRTHRYRSRLWSRAVVATLMVASGAAVAVAANAAAAGCGVTYTVASQWQGGFTGDVSVTNLGDPVSSWTLTWSYSAGQQVTQAWNATVTQSGSQVTARNASYNGGLATGASTSFGFNGSWTGSNPAPTAFALNGTTCTGAPGGPSTTPPQQPPTTRPPTTPPTSGPTTPPSGNPDWGRSLPPAGAQTSHAYDLIVMNDPKGYAPAAGECSKEIHARYWTYGPDGKVYPTWHPARDPSGCSFGHEHGDDPRTSNLFATVGWPAFGYTSEVMMSTNPDSGQRHEDHVGHKVLAVNRVNVIQGDNGTSFFPPSGTTVAVCDVLLKFHQGTHSADAFTNNVHELLYNNRCTHNDNGQVSEARFSAMIPLGRPGGFGNTDCPGPNLGGQFTNVGPAVPADSPSDTRSLGRLITDQNCVQAIRDGKTHFEVTTNSNVPFDTNDLHEFWFSDVTVSSSQLTFNIAPLFYVLNPSRYYDASLSNHLAHQVDLCYSGIRGQYCDQVRQITQQTGQQVAWDDPRSPFKGTLREYRPGTFTVRNTGPTTVYTDVYGRNVSTSPFPGSIRQYFSGNHAPVQTYVRGATRDYAANTADKIHAPN